MSKYVVNISGKDLSIEQQVSRGLADQIAFLLINERVGRVASSKNIPKNKIDKNVKTKTNNPITEAQTTELLKFIDAHNASGRGELLTCLGLFLHDNGHDFFTKNEYRHYFKILKGTGPTNTPRDFKRALSNNWISEIAPEQFKVTSIGEKMAKEA